MSLPGINNVTSTQVNLNQDLNATGAAQNQNSQIRELVGRAEVHPEPQPKVHRSVGEIIGRVALGVVTVGISEAVIAIVNKVRAGSTAEVQPQTAPQQEVPVNNPSVAQQPVAIENESLLQNLNMNQEPVQVQGQVQNQPPVQNANVQDQALSIAEARARFLEQPPADVSSRQKLGQAIRDGQRLPDEYYAASKQAFENVKANFGAHADKIDAFKDEASFQALLDRPESKEFLANNISSSFAKGTPVESFQRLVERHATNHLRMQVLENMAQEKGLLADDINQLLPKFKTELGKCTTAEQITQVSEQFADEIDSCVALKNDVKSALLNTAEDKLADSISTALKKNRVTMDADQIKAHPGWQGMLDQIADEVNLKKMGVKFNMADDKLQKAVDKAVTDFANGVAKAYTLGGPDALKADTHELALSSPTFRRNCGRYHNVSYEMAQTKDLDALAQEIKQADRPTQAMAEKLASIFSKATQWFDRQKITVSDADRLDIALNGFQRFLFDDKGATLQDAFTNKLALLNEMATQFKNDPNPEIREFAQALPQILSSRGFMADSFANGLSIAPQYEAVIGNAFVDLNESMGQFLPAGINGVQDLPDQARFRQLVGEGIKKFDGAMTPEAFQGIVRDAAWAVMPALVQQKYEADNNLPAGALSVVSDLSAKLARAKDTADVNDIMLAAEDSFKNFMRQYDNALPDIQNQMLQDVSKILKISPQELSEKPFWQTLVNELKDRFFEGNIKEVFSTESNRVMQEKITNRLRSCERLLVGELGAQFNSIDRMPNVLTELKNEWKQEILTNPEFRKTFDAAKMGGANMAQSPVFAAIIKEFNGTQDAGVLVELFKVLLQDAGAVNREQGLLLLQMAMNANPALVEVINQNPDLINSVIDLCHRGNDSQQQAIGQMLTDLKASMPMFAVNSFEGLDHRVRFAQYIPEAFVELRLAMGRFMPGNITGVDALPDQARFNSLVANKLNAHVGALTPETYKEIVKSAAWEVLCSSVVNDFAAMTGMNVQQLNATHGLQEAILNAKSNTDIDIALATAANKVIAFQQSCETALSQVQDQAIARFSSEFSMRVSPEALAAHAPWQQIQPALQNAVSQLDVNATNEDIKAALNKAMDPMINEWNDIKNNLDSYNVLSPRIRNQWMNKLMQSPSFPYEVYASAAKQMRANDSFKQYRAMVNDPNMKRGELEQGFKDMMEDFITDYKRKNPQVANPEEVAIYAFQGALSKRTESHDRLNHYIDTFKDIYDANKNSADPVNQRFARAIEPFIDYRDRLSGWCNQPTNHRLPGKIDSIMANVRNEAIALAQQLGKDVVIPSDMKDFWVDQTTQLPEALKPFSNNTQMQSLEGIESKVRELVLNAIRNS